jgi:hypothetical protein
MGGEPKNEAHRSLYHDTKSPPQAEVAAVDLREASTCDERGWLHASPATSAGGEERVLALPGSVGAAISRENLVHRLGAIRTRGAVENDGLLTIFLDHLRVVGRQLLGIGQRQPIA